MDSYELKQIFKKMERIENSIDETHTEVEQKMIVRDLKVNKLNECEELLKSATTKQEVGHAKTELKLAKWCLEQVDKDLNKLYKKIEKLTDNLETLKSDSEIQKITKMVTKEVKDFVEKAVRSQYKHIKMDDKELKEKYIKMDIRSICENIAARAYSIVENVERWEINYSLSRNGFEVKAYGDASHKFYAHLDNTIVHPYIRTQYGEMVLVRAHYRSITNKCKI